MSGYRAVSETTVIHAGAKIRFNVSVAGIGTSSRDTVFALLSQVPGFSIISVGTNLLTLPIPGETSYSVEATCTVDITPENLRFSITEGLNGATPWYIPYSYSMTDAVEVYTDTAVSDWADKVLTTGKWGAISLAVLAVVGLVVALKLGLLDD